MSKDRVMSGAELARRAQAAAARGLNRAANAVVAEAIPETPLGPAKDAPKGGPEGEGHEGGGGTGALRRSYAYPLIDESHAATPHNLVALITVNEIYAAAQHEGHAIMHRMTEGGMITYEWEVRQYTTPGTKRKYLEDPLKAAVGRGDIEDAVALEFRREFSA